MTLMVLTLMTARTGHCSDYSAMQGSDPVAFDRTKLGGGPDPLDAARHQFGLLFNTIRQQAPHLAPGPAANILHDPRGWADAQMDGIEDTLGIGGSPDAGTSENKGGNEEGGIASVIHPVAAFLQPPKAEDNEAMWVTPGYKHRDLLPLHDALILGFGARHGMWDNRLRVELQPYYGQNWVSPAGYWGTRISAAIAPDAMAKPWGKITLGFDDGDSSLMDQGHGFSLHSEWNLSDRLKLDAGMRSHEASRSDNFVMVRWHILGE